MQDVVMIHNQFLELLKSVRIMTDVIFQNTIKEYTYNYSSRSLQQDKLYDNFTTSLPSCTITMERYEPRDQYPRYFNHTTLDYIDGTIIAKNETLEEDLYLHARWYDVYFSITLNLESPAVMLDYYHRLKDSIPQNFQSFCYGYLSHVNIPQSFIPEWDIFTHCTKNIELSYDKSSATPFISTSVQQEPIIQWDNTSMETPNMEMNGSSFTANIILSFQVPYRLILRKREKPIKHVTFQLSLRDVSYEPVILTFFEADNQYRELNEIKDAFRMNFSADDPIEKDGEYIFTFKYTKELETTLKKYKDGIIYCNPDQFKKSNPTFQTFFEPKLIINPAIIMLKTKIPEDPPTIRSINKLILYNKFEGENKC